MSTLDFSIKFKYITGFNLIILRNDNINCVLLVSTAVDFNFYIRVKLRYNTTLGEYIKFIN